MLVSKSGGARPVPVQSLDDVRTCPAKAALRGPAEVQNQDGDWILPLISNAIDTSHPGARTKAAHEMHLDPSYMNRLLAADGHLSVRKLGLLGEPFWRALHNELSAHFGFEDHQAQLARAFDAVASGLSVIRDITARTIR